jgi:hypothetical protein
MSEIFNCSAGQSFRRGWFLRSSWQIAHYLGGFELYCRVNRHWKSISIVASAWMWVLLILSLYSAEVFRKFLYSILRVHFYTQNDRLLRSSKEDSCVLRLLKITDSKTSWMKVCKTLLLNSHNVLSAFTTATVITKFGCQAQATEYSTDTEMRSRPRMHFTQPVSLKCTLQSFDTLHWSLQTTAFWNNLALLYNAGWAKIPRAPVLEVGSPINKTF